MNAPSKNFCSPQTFLAVIAPAAHVRLRNVISI
jgi:hypothetical protein